MSWHPVYGFLYAGPVDLTDGRVAYVMPLVLGQARLNVGGDFVDDSY